MGWSPENRFGYGVQAWVAAQYAVSYQRVFRYCLRRLYDRDVAEDATAAVFARFADKCVRLCGLSDSRVRAWLYRTASHVVAHTMRRNRAYARVLASVAHEAGEARAMPPDGQRDWLLLYDAIVQLPEKCQAVVILRYFEGLEFDEIADIVGMRQGAVRTALSRGIAMLRERLRGTHDE